MDEAGQGEHTRIPPRITPGVMTALVIVVTGAAIILSVLRLFHPYIKLGGLLEATHFFYLLAMLMLPPVFLFLPARKDGPRDRVPWYDLSLFVLTFVCMFFYLWNAHHIHVDGWDFDPPGFALGAAILGWLLLLEIGRRAGGLPIFLITGVVSLYPLIADDLPALIDGHTYDFAGAISFHIYSVESFLGPTMRAYGELAFGYLIFGAALQHSGGGRFFLDLAYALLGKGRGGPAKVAVVASGLMGSMSGSVVSNVLTTGSVTVPVMRRTGFHAAYAGGVEAAASTGGVLMPPVMGAAAFVMASIMGVRYADIAAAAVIPSLLYFFGLFVQIDSYAARHNMAGLAPDLLPRIGNTLRGGWHYLFSFIVLMLLLLVLGWQQSAPYWATLVLLISQAWAQKTKYRWRDFQVFILGTGEQLVTLAGLLAPVGLIIGALMMTGMIGNFTYDMLSVAGDNVLILLILGAVTSFILGIGMTVAAAYLFLAITLAPTLIAVGIEPMAAHMFILYWGMLSYITPPVAIGAFAAAGLANAPPMRTAVEAMRLGTVIYFIPFFFVFNPALLGMGNVEEVMSVTLTALLGVVVVASGLQGHLVLFGGLGRGAFALVGRFLMVGAGLSLVAPAGTLGLSGWVLLLAALGLFLPALLLCRLARN
ncbi:MAG: TRAP transporter fused permease subunit [Rhodospirillaceae bacterium]|nr:TRAP transporter fused permease subunit [Rhodospirillaceae bacterium]